ncbi:MAG: hypothetical protein K940chlam3_01035, partial [Chlamydiae bacterium]|nr:hypothetical protein [Chlamydiota bacterium]
MLPKHLKIYRDDAQKLLERDAVQDCEFSGGTYQIQVGEAWAFLQMNSQGKLIDGFCSCDEQDDNQGCVHQAAAYLYVLGELEIPLHFRFERSFWNFLCFIFSGIVDDDLTPPKNLEEGHYIYEKIFEVKGTTKKGKEWIKESIEKSGQATEDTSIKFSNLPQEELALWREGNPSKELKYELSFWSDLAKKLFLLQSTDHPYTIQFQGPKNKLPDKIEVKFDDFQLTFTLPEVFWPLILPTLGTVESSLKVYGLEEEGEVELYFDSVKGLMEIRAKEVEPEKVASEKEGITFDGWLYVPGDGFYPRSKTGLFSESVLTGNRVGELLTRYFPTVRSLLVGEKLTRKKVTISYTLSFDKKWNLRISAYVFKPGDLSQPEAHIFGDWLYLSEQGFMPYKGKEFYSVDTVIDYSDMNNFVSKSRSWLSSQKGFETHQANIEAQLVYSVDESNCLRFSSRVAFDEEVGSQMDFGQWIYIEDEGFYQKSTGQLGLPVKPEQTIKPNEIPLFIRMNLDELALISGFFGKKCPVEKSGLSVQVYDDGNIFIDIIHVRRPEYENAELKFFDEYVYFPGEGFSKLPIDPRIPEHYHIPCEIQGEKKLAFLSYELDQIAPFIIDLDPRLKKLEELQLVIQKIDDQDDSLNVKLCYRSELGEVDGRDVLAAVLAKERFVCTHAGLIDLKQDRFGWLYQLDKKALGTARKGLLLKTLDILRLMAFEKVEVPAGKSVRAENVRERLKSLTEFTPPSEPILEGFQAELRPYQEVGLKWLWFLYHQRLSGLLCDDMGLGKTLQSMALIASIMNTKRRHRHFLIVCPTSVIYHWQDKFHKFFPKCKVFTFYGSQRSLAGFREEYDVLLTSYGIWRREKDLLGQIPFEVAILDEIQVAKNYRSKLHGALATIQARMLVGLTGTPIENYLRELKSIFDIVLPSYMPGATDFRDFFTLPIEKQQNKKRRQLLSRFIHPFILRRKKEDVLLDLPDKIEEITYVPLLPQQQELYKETLEQSRASILREMSTEGHPVPYLHVFALLARLKQICDHPAVYHQNAEEYEKFQSGKWERFTEIIDEVRDSGQKVVVFSQYLTQLDIIENYLRKAGIEFAGIRGATVRRGEEIKRFQEDPKCAVFVASLQAAGLGIDLTAASVVIHYDRWWNAARENQATDRVHRIGQERGVQVFKLVTRGTFEEKIHQMILRKGRLMEEVVGVDDQTLIKSLSKENILELLEDVEFSRED